MKNKNRIFWKAQGPHVVHKPLFGHLVIYHLFFILWPVAMVPHIVTSGRVTPECAKVNKRLAKKAENCKEPNVAVMTYQSSDLHYQAAPLLQYEAFMANEAMLTSRISRTLTIL